MQMNVDQMRMQEALRLAQRGVGTTSPNPPVGAVLYADGKLIGEGYHEKAGEAHAERRAIQDAVERGFADKLRGSVLYVTLEPCSSYGKTPPCTSAILEAGIDRVVYGMNDPDKRHSGRAKAILETGGVRVLGGVNEEACRAFLRPWVHSVETGLPWVTAKVACTLDGSLTRCKERWISCAESLKYAHELRLQSDAILTGGATVRADDPAFTIRTPLSEIPVCKQQPWRVVLTHNRSLLPDRAQIFTDAFANRTIVYEKVECLKDVLRELHEHYGVVKLLLECGGKLLRQFLNQGLVQEWVQDIAPIISGGADSVVPGDFLPREIRLREVTVQQADVDYILRGILETSED